MGAVGLVTLTGLFQRIKNIVGALLPSHVPSYYDHCHELAKMNILEILLLLSF